MVCFFKPKCVHQALPISEPKPVWKQRRWVVLVIAAALVICILSFYLAYRELCKYWKEHEILIEYGGMFLSDEDIELVKDLEFSRLPVKVANVTDKAVEGFCFSNCSSRFMTTNNNNSNSNSNSNNGNNNYKTQNVLYPSLGRSLDRSEGRPVQTKGVFDGNQKSYHGCCISERVVHKPVRAKDARGKDVIVVQFRKRKQIYFVDECKQANDCTGCCCTQRTTLAPALVIDDDGRDLSRLPAVNRGNFRNFRLGLIQIPGCCKCMNNARC